MNTYIENDKKVTKDLYEFICRKEKQEPVKLTFKKLGRASGCCSYLQFRNSKVPNEIIINLETGSFGAAYVLIHEFAHKVLIRKNGDATHSAAFRREVKRLEGKYANCKIANELIF